MTSSGVCPCRLWVGWMHQHPGFQKAAHREHKAERMSSAHEGAQAERVSGGLEWRESSLGWIGDSGRCCGAESKGVSVWLSSLNTLEVVQGMIREVMRPCTGERVGGCKGLLLGWIGVRSRNCAAASPWLCQWGTQVSKTRRAGSTRRSAGSYR